MQMTPPLWQKEKRNYKEPLDESEKAGLKLYIQKTKIMASGPITSWQIDGETMEIVTDFVFLGSKITIEGDSHHEIRRGLLLGSKSVQLTRWTFVGKVMSLLFNMLSRLVIAFLPRNKQASFNFMAAVTICSDFGALENKVCHYFHCFPIYLP